MHATAEPNGCLPSCRPNILDPALPLMEDPSLSPNFQAHTVLLAPWRNGPGARIFVMRTIRGYPPLFRDLAVLWSKKKTCRSRLHEK